MAYCYSPLLSQPWILDADVTVKTLYGKQEGAVVGYNPHKSGRPSHTYHTYMIANLRLILEVEVSGRRPKFSRLFRARLMGLTGPYAGLEMAHFYSGRL